MAVVVAPKMIAPGSWIEFVIEAEANLPDHTALQRLLAITMLRYNTANEEAADPARLKTGWAVVRPRRSSPGPTVSRPSRHATRWRDRAYGLQGR